MGTLRSDPDPASTPRDDYVGHVIYSDRYIDRDTPLPFDERRASAAEMTSGSGFELFAATLALVLAVLGLAGLAPVQMAAMGLIGVGFALLAQGGTLATRWRTATHIPATERTERVGIGTEMVGGFAGIVIGVLAVIGVSPLVLLPAGALVLGASLLLGGPAQPALAEDDARSDRRWHVTRDAVRASGGVMVMAGVAALVLGILAFAGGPVVTLSLVAVLCVAAGLITAGGALIARIARRFA